MVVVVGRSREKDYVGKPQRRLSLKTCTCAMLSEGDPKATENTVNEPQPRAGCAQLQEVAKPRGGL